MQKLIRIHLFIFLSLLSWKFSCWDRLDVACAYFCNSFIHKSTFWQNFWAFFNSVYADWIFDGIMASFLIPYIFENKPKLRRIIELSIFGFLLLFCYKFNRFLCESLLCLVRESPSGVLPDLFNLSEVIHWTKVKVHSSASYPSGHALTICIFLIGVCHFRGPRIFFPALFISIPFTLPRLITGAHWITDVFMGSFLISLFILGWFFYTPVFGFLTNKALSFGKILRKNLSRTL